jgi:hypothetical protein
LGGSDPTQKEMAGVRYSVLSATSIG